MESPQKPPQAHTLLFPLPVQGHITPMLQFAKRLVSRGLKATLVTTLHLSKSIRIDPSAAASSSINIETVSDCQGGDGQPQGKSSEAHQMSGSRTLAELIRELDRSAQPVIAVVYDGFMPWALDVAKQCKLELLSSRRPAR
ncbi:UDP-glycosyltransferase 74G1-like [Syzygium oleosum]|uniref:UDP-glycosyltransferase 74G1-like n=1 Tax=Syzygium oleosum TaxID=219896 RepID=UPI0024BAE456|nr:UDP-glycosyltransferase 74G1-like [Syzygium oleosum]